MTAWPSIMAPSFPLDESIYKPQVRSEFEAGYVQTRPRATRERRIFKLNWLALPTADWATLDAFFVANIGGTFTWTNPEDSQSYTVRFADDSLESQIRSNGLRTVSLTLEED